MPCRNCYCTECRELYGQPQDSRRTGERTSDPAPADRRAELIAQAKANIRREEPQ